MRWPRASSREIHTEIVIEAPPSRVWQALVDFENYPRWNQFIPMAQGQLAQAAVLKILIHPPGGRSQHYNVRVVNIVPGSQLDWLGHFGLPGLIDGHHVFCLQQVAANRTLLIHREKFVGLLVPFVWQSFLNVKLRAGFILMNETLKRFIEDGE